MRFLVAGTILLGLFLAAFYNYPFFHSLSEIFSIVISYSIFIFVWNWRRFLDNNYLAFIGVSFFFIGFIEALHFLAYPPFGVFPGHNYDLFIQLWTIAGYFQAAAFLISPFLLGRRLRLDYALAGLFVVTLFLLASLFYWETFPSCFIAGKGFTLFKKTSEYLIALAFFISLVMLFKKRGYFDKRVFKLLSASIVMITLSQLLSVFSKENMDAFSAGGHFLELGAFYHLYKALVESGLHQPFNTLFRNLKSSQERLREEKDRVQKYLNIIGTMLVIIDSEEKVSLINKKGSEILGYRQENIIGKNWFDNFIPERMRQEIRGVFLKLMSAEVEPVEYFENPVLDRDGEERLIAWHNTVLRDDKGRVVAALSSGEDITERRQIEEALKKAHDELELKVEERTVELLQANRQLKQEVLERQEKERQIRISNAILKLFAKVSSRKDYLNAVVKLLKGLSGCRCVGIRMLDGQERIPYESYIGFSQEFWRSENFLSLNHDQCVCTWVITGRPDPEYSDQMTKGGSFCCGNTMVFFSSLPERERGKFRNICVQNGFASVAVIPIRYNDKIIGAIHLADEQEGKVSSRFVEFIEFLTPIIGEGAHELALSDRFKQAQKELADNKRLSDIGTLAATVAHELRNPLGVIRTAAYNIKRKAQNPLLESNLANIEKKILESDQIINNLLFYSRIKMLNYETVKICDILSDCINSVKKHSPGHKVSVNASLKSIKGVSIEADPLQMEELFSNIINNAYDAVCAGGTTIEVGASLEEENGLVSIYVKDDAMGIDSQNLDKIFEPFFTTKAKGTGLGLAVCRQIANLHGGKIEVESVKGQGTTFIVTLPVSRNLKR